MFAWLPENISTYGGDIDAIFKLIYYVVGVWFVATQAFLVYCLIRYRRRGENQRAKYAPGNTISQAAWVLIPCALVMVLDLWIDFRGADVWAKVKLSNPTPDLVVRVVGRQFNWIVIYPGPDGKFGTADDRKIDNDLHVPVNKVVRVILTGEDVIHSFYLPHLRLKQDIVPGREIPAWFEATKTGKFEIPCAELCGFGHSGMKGYLYVHSEADFKTWTQKQWSSVK